MNGNIGGNMNNFQIPTQDNQRPIINLQNAFRTSIKTAVDDYCEGNKILMLQHSYNVPTRYSEVNNTLPQLASKSIVNFDLNPMTKEIMLVSDHEVCVFDIELNEIKVFKSFKQIINTKYDPTPQMQNLGEMKLPQENKVKFKDVELNQQQDSPSNSLVQNNEKFTYLVHFSLSRPTSLHLYNKWAIIKNNKQVLFGDSNLMYSKDTISDSNGIANITVNQKREEIISLTKDLRQARIWSYMIYYKAKPMPPVDELPINSNNIDPNVHVFITNRKNIHVNLPIYQMQVNPTADLIVFSSLESNSITVFTTMEGKNLYSLDYQGDERGNLNLVKHKYNHDKGFLKPLGNQVQMSPTSQGPNTNCRGSNCFLVKMHQEYLYFLNHRNNQLIIWDLGQESVIYNLDLSSILQLDSSKTVLFVYPNLCNGQTGLLLIDSDQSLYYFSLTQWRTKNIIYKSFTNNLHQNTHLREQVLNIELLKQQSAKKRKSQQKNQIFDFSDEALDLMGFDPTSLPKYEMNELKRQGSQRKVNKKKNFHMRYIMNQDGTRNIFLLEEGAREIQIITCYSDLDLGIDMSKQGVYDMKYVYPSPFKSHYFKDGRSHRDLIPFVDMKNYLHLVDTKSQRERLLQSINLMDYPQSYSLTELPVLPPEQKFRKEPFFRDKNRSFYFDIMHRIGVILDNNGFCCIFNTHYKTKKFIYLEDKYKVRKIFIMTPLEDIQPYQEQLYNKPRKYLTLNFDIANYEEFQTQENIYKLLEEQPDFDFKVGIITQDGQIIILSNESRFGDLRISHKINLQTAILQARYLSDKGKLIIIAKEGVFRIYDVFNDMKILKQFNLLWADVSALDMKSDELIIVGHESGIIYTQPIKGDIKISEINIYNFHRQPILQLATPINEPNSNKFISISKDNSLVLFQFEKQRPLRVMKFFQYFTRIVYISGNEVFAFNSLAMFKIDLLHAVPYSENNMRKLKKEWREIVEMRALKNQGVRKLLQIEEQKNDMFSGFQTMKKSYSAHHRGKLPLVQMIRYYLGMVGEENVYSGEFLLELDHILSKKHSLPLEKYLYMEPLKQTIQIYMKIKKEQENQNQGYEENKNIVEKRVYKQQISSMKEEVFFKKLKQLGKINKQHKNSLMKGDSKSLQQSQNGNKIGQSNPLSSAVLSKDISVKNFSTQDFQNENIMELKEEDDTSRGFLKIPVRSPAHLSQQPQATFSNVLSSQCQSRGSIISPVQSEQIKRDPENNKNLIKGKFQAFLSEVQKQSDAQIQRIKQDKQGNFILQRQQSVNSVSHNSNSQYMARRNNSQRQIKANNISVKDLQNSQQRKQQSIPQLFPSAVQIRTSSFINQKNSQQIKSQPKLEIQSPSSKNLQFQMTPSASMQQYTQGLYHIRNKIKEHESRAQTAAADQNNLKQSQKKIASPSKKTNRPATRYTEKLVTENKFLQTQKMSTQFNSQESTINPNSSANNYYAQPHLMQTQQPQQQKWVLVSKRGSQDERPGTQATIRKSVGSSVETLKKTTETSSPGLIKRIRLESNEDREELGEGIEIKITKFEPKENTSKKGRSMLRDEEQIEYDPKVLNILNEKMKKDLKCTVSKIDNVRPIHFPKHLKKDYLKQRNAQSLSDWKKQFEKVGFKVEDYWPGGESVYRDYLQLAIKKQKESEFSLRPFHNDKLVTINSIQEDSITEEGIASRLYSKLQSPNKSPMTKALLSPVNKTTIRSKEFTPKFKTTEDLLNNTSRYKLIKSLMRENQSEEKRKAQSLSMERFQGQEETEKNYIKALKRLLCLDKERIDMRINLIEKKAQLEQGKKPASPSKLKDLIQKSQKETERDLKDNGSDDDQDSKLLNEEQRSLIVEEILKCDQELVFEMSSDENEGGEGSRNINASFSSKQNNSSSPLRSGRITTNKKKQVKKVRMVTSDQATQNVKQVRLRDLENAAEIHRKNIKLTQDRLKAIKAAKEGLEQGFLSAKQMQIKKQSKKEKKAQKYFLLKEYFRDRVSIKKIGSTFRIIIPKNNNLGLSKLNTKKMDTKEFYRNYNTFKIDVKDIIKCIREQEDLSNTDYISKEKVASYLKKNLQKLMVPEEPDELDGGNDYRDQIAKLELAKSRKANRDLEKVLKRQKFEEELEMKKDKIRREKDDMMKKRLEQEDKKRKEIAAQIYRTVDSVTPQPDAQGNLPSDRKTISRGPGSRQGFQQIGEGQIQMVIATELNIAERKSEINKRLEHLRIERELERIRQEKNQIYHFVREKIVKGTILANVIKHIRKTILEEKQASREKKSRGRNPDFNKIKSAYSQNLLIQSRTQLEKKITRNMTKTNISPKFTKNTLSQNSLEKQSAQNIEVDDDSLSQGQLLQNESAQTLQKEVSSSSVSQESDENPPHLNLNLKLEKIPSVIKTTEREESKVITIQELPVPPVLIKNKNSLSSSGPGGSKTMINTPKRVLQQQDSIVNNQSKGKKSKYLGLKSSAEQSSEYFYYDEDIKSKKKSLHSRNNSQHKKPQTDEIEEQSEYYEEQPEQEEKESKDSYGATPNELSTKQSPRRFLNIFKQTEKINDYALELSQTPGTAYYGNQNDVPIEEAPLPVFDEDQDTVSPEEVQKKIEVEMQYQRILEKITQKIMSKRITAFKKELLIRIALNLERMERIDLDELEVLLEHYESTEPEVKQKIIDLFQVKYQIDLAANLQELVEEKMNQIKDERKIEKQKRVRKLLLTKFRMINFMSKFCKANEQNAIKNANKNAQKLLKDLLDQDEAENQSDDDGSSLALLQQNMNQVLMSLFSNDEKIISQQLRDYKQEYKMKFSSQPEYTLAFNKDIDQDSNKEAQDYYRIQAFLQFDKKLRQLLPEEWHHKDIVPVLIDLYSNEQFDYLKHLQHTQNFSSFYDLAKEIMSTLAVTRKEHREKQREIEMRHRRESSLEFTFQEQVQNENSLTNKKLNLELLEMRRNNAFADLEIDERKYCILKLQAHLSEMERIAPLELDYMEKRYDLSNAMVRNIMDPNIQKRLLERDSIANLRKEKQLIDPLLNQMEIAAETHEINKELTQNLKDRIDGAHLPI